MGIYDVDAIAEQWLYEQLVGHAPLVALVGENTALNMPQIYRGVAPQDGATYPYVIFNNQTEGGINEMTMNSTIVWNNTIYLVKVEGLQDDSDLLSRINKAIRDALHQKDGDTLGGRVIACAQERTFVFPPDEIDGVIYETRGGLYRLLVQESA